MGRSSSALASLGRTLIIGNPSSHSGRGQAAVTAVSALFEHHPHAASFVEIYRTRHEGDALRRAADAAGFDTVIAVGGDGVIHDVVNGLMRVTPALRPALGIVAVGTGNDFARTLGAPRNNPQASITSIVTGFQQPIDIGRVNDQYFMETLSFGLDAAVAIGTITDRDDKAERNGATVYARSAFTTITRAGTGWSGTMRFDGAQPQRFNSLIFAVQNGPTYGAGFRITPGATPTDGLLDTCFSVGRPTVPEIAVVIGLARIGHHTRSKALQFQRTRQLIIDFDTVQRAGHVRGYVSRRFASAAADVANALTPHLHHADSAEHRMNAPVVPCQVDGEAYVPANNATHFDISVIPRALRVFVPRLGARRI
ncbi:MAG: YegS/Rv2252/BmrU family lipid kinase [Actinomycetaceae bacterium]|nr:YegS/Rv2252/BmrU family lipid kinase [Actinomycetaceae bacterium]MDY6083410.1 YegS/Rv2252/BmrU family lipid kinase [Actinomycetaceae bacterium]